MRDDSAEILFQSFLQEAPVSSFGMGMDVHSLMMSIQHFLRRRRRRPPSKVPWTALILKVFFRSPPVFRFRSSVIFELVGLTGLFARNIIHDMLIG